MSRPSGAGNPPREGLSIFVSYRRDDASGEAGRLYDALTSGNPPPFSESQVFMDVDAIEPGVDFRREIASAVDGCDVLLAMIGRTWVTAADDAGRRRLDDENDFVRIEIETALQRDVRVVPVPVRGARMPNPSDLPESLRDLAFRQAHPLDHSRWRSDVSQLIDWLKRLEQQSQQPTGLTAGPVVDDPSDTSRKALDRLDSPSRRAKASATRPIRIFVAYDRTDQWIVHALRIHLAPHEKKGLIGAWEERDITVGDDWMKHASNEVEQADIFLLLVSQRFLTSPYPKGMEFQLALKRGHSGAVIVPVLVDENAWHRSPLGKFQALPKGGRPILSWPHPDPALADAARGIVAVADDLRSGGNGYGW